MMRGLVLGLLSLFFVANFAYGACGGGGWKKDSTPQYDSYSPPNSKDDSTPASKAPSVVSPAAHASAPATTPARPAPKNAPASPSAAPTQFAVSALVRTGGKALDTAQFDAMSSKLGLTDMQRKDVDKAKSEIQSELERLRAVHQAAEQKYATCDGDCANEYNKLNKSTEDLKNYSPEKEFERRLTAILQPNQLQTYQSDVKKNGDPQPKKS